MCSRMPLPERKRALSGSDQEETRNIQHIHFEVLFWMKHFEEDAKNWAIDVLMDAFTSGR